MNLAFVDAFRAERAAAGAKPKTIHNDTVTLRQIVNFALSRGLIAEDPLRGLKTKKPKPTPQPCWTPEEVERILAAASSRYRPVLTFLADTGMRVGEVKHLTWDDIDPERHVAFVQPKDGWRPKTGDRRIVPLTPRVEEILRGLTRRGRWVFTSAPTQELPRGDAQVSERRLLQHLKRVLAKLGLAGHVHTLRHSFVSRALQLGIPEATVRACVGHVDRATLALYTHITAPDLEAARKKLAAGSVLAATLPPSIPETPT